MTRMFENAIKTVRNENGKRASVIPSEYDIGATDFSDLLEMTFSGDRDQQWRALVMSFEFGFVMGNRATISRNIKRL